MSYSMASKSSEINMNLRHVPYLLERQILSQYNKEFILSTNTEQLPSIRRFYGALLFVDISGFTALSQKLDVDLLRTHINGYFQKILDIVERFGGDVVKFAGDALYIVWQAVVSPLGNEKVEEESLLSCVKDSVSCGWEIVQKCSNHEIIIDPNDRDGNRNNGLKPIVNKSKQSSQSQKFLLDVHAGLSVGLMAGIDVGFKDRWEYFIVGEPLNEVAKAESEAKKGEFVISPLAHTLLHRIPNTGLQKSLSRIPTNDDDLNDDSNETKSSVTKSEENIVRKRRTSAFSFKTCGCMVSASGCVKASRCFFNEQKSVNRIEPGSGAEQNSFVNGTESDAQRLMKLKNDVTLLHDRHFSSKHNKLISKDSAIFGIEERLHAHFKSTFREKKMSSRNIQKKIREFFQLWVENHLCSMIEWHTHTAYRQQRKNSIVGFPSNKLLGRIVENSSSDMLSKSFEGFVVSTTRSNSFKRESSSTELFMIQNKSSDDLDDSGPKSIGKQCSRDDSDLPYLSSTRFKSSPNLRSQRKSFDSLPVLTSKTKELKSNSIGLGLVDKISTEFLSTSELRTVIVMFISIHMPTDMRSPTEGLHIVSEGVSDRLNKLMRPLLTSTKSFNSNLSQESITIDDVHTYDDLLASFGFIDCAIDEERFDSNLLNKMQGCYSIICGTLKGNGGQLRQFIVDDKGTVAIGTFGLRGSASYDNAAAAVETANSIFNQLKEIQLSASIGLTAGKAYCGLVGSNFRHEYAVMGPSTNLSARLMGKAKPGEVICDNEICNRDRSHEFINLGGIQAKGYEFPVSIYSPDWNQKLDGNEELILSNQQKSSFFFSSAMPSFLNKRPNLSIPVVQFSKIRILPSLWKTEPKNSLVAENKRNDASPKQLVPLGAPKDQQQTLDQKRPVNGVHKSDHQANVIHGRNDEADTFFRFIQSMLYKESPAEEKISMLLSKTLDENDGNVQIQNKLPDFVFDNSQNTFHTMVKGPHGIGKSAFIYSLLAKFTILSSTDSYYNLKIFHNKGSEYTISQPFLLFQPIVRKVLVLYSKLKKTEVKDLNQPFAYKDYCLSKLFKKQHHSSGKYSLDDNQNDAIEKQIENEVSGTKYKKKEFTLIEEGLDFFFECCDHWKPFKSLLSWIKLLPSKYPETEDISKMTNAARLEKVEEMILEMLQQFTAISGQVLLIFLDDIQFSDLSSLNLLYRICKENKGVIAISAYRPLNANDTASQKLSLAAKKTKTLLDSFDHSSEINCLVIKLDTLDLNATKRVVKSIFKCNGIDSTHQSVSKKIHEISGGNPLYIYEISKALVDKYYSVIKNSTNLTHQIVKADSITDRDNEESAGNSSQVLQNMLNNFCNHRIEEVILYRFDRLNHMAQLILKVASVACRNGACFTFQMINSIRTNSALFSNLQKNKHPSVDNTDLVKCFNTILRDSDFIRFKSRGSPRSSTADMAVFNLINEDFSQESEYYDLSETDLMELQFEFRITMEQITIYDIMLADQKRLVHSQVANYLQKVANDQSAFKFEMSMSQDMSRSDDGFSRSNRVVELGEQAYHWGLSGLWSSAMVAYYESAMALDQLGAYLDSFQQLNSAYRMLNELRYSAKIVDSLSNPRCKISGMETVDQAKSVEESSHALQSINLLTEKVEKSSSASDSPTANNQKSKPQRIRRISSNAIYELEFVLIRNMTREDVYKLFQGNADHLETALNVLLRLGQSSFTLIEDSPFTSKLYEEALQLINLTKVDLSKEHHSTCNFGLKNTAICFPTLSGIAALYRNNRLKDDAERSKEMNVINLFLESAAANKDLYKPHLLVSMCLKRNLLYELNYIQEALDLSDLILELYDYDQHSQTLVEAYGNDRIPYTLATNTQLLLMLMQMEKLNKYIEFLTALMPKITHMHTLGICVFPVCFTATTMGQTSNPYQWFNYYHTTLEARGGYSFFKGSNYLYLEWLRLRDLFPDLVSSKDTRMEFFRLHESKNQKGVQQEPTAFLNYTQDEIVSHCNDLNNLLSTPNEIRLLSFEYLHFPISKRLLLFESMDSFGVSVECICAEMCFSKAMLWIFFSMKLNSEDIEKKLGTSVAEMQRLGLKYLISAIFYINYAKSCNKRAKVSLSHCRVLVIRAIILMGLRWFCMLNSNSSLNMKELVTELHTKITSSITEPLSDNSHIPLEELMKKMTVENCLKDAQNDLLECYQMAESLHYKTLQLISGSFLCDLDIDIDLGRKLQQETMKEYDPRHDPRIISELDTAFSYDKLRTILLPEN